MHTEIHVQPSLFMFFGTSAAKVGWRLKQSMDGFYGQLPIYRYLWIDVTNNIEDPEAARWFSTMERAELAGFNADEVLAHLDAYPAIKAWWPRETRLKAGFVRDGANQIRLLGRLALFRMFNDRNAGPAFIDKLRYVTEALAQIENAAQTEAMSTAGKRYVVDRGIARIYAVFSACGGSGSAMCWDVAHLVRHLLRGSNPTLIGITMMPPVIDAAIKNETQTQREKIRANAYAWFKESDSQRANPHWRVEYPEGAPVDHHAVPFDLQFVQDIINQAGDRLNSADDVYTMIANAIFLDTGSAIGGAIRGFNANVSVLHEEFQGRRRAYSSFASASLIYPAQKILGYCSAELSGAMVRHGLLTRADHAEMVEMASALLGRLQLRDDRVLQTLLAGTRFPAHHAVAIRKAQTVETVRTLLAEQEKHDEQARRRQVERIQQTGEALSAKATSALENDLAILAVKGGVPMARALLDIMVEEIGYDGPVPDTTRSLPGFKARVHQQGIGEADLAQAHKEYTASLARLQVLGGGFWQALRRTIRPKAWKRDFEQARNDCLYWQGEVNQRTLQLAAQRAAGDIYDQTVEHARAGNRTLGRIRQTLERQVEHFAEDAHERLKPATAADGIYELALEAVDAEYMRRYYAKHGGSVASPQGAAVAYQAAVQHVSPPDLATVESWMESGLADTLREHAASYFVEEIESTSLLDALVDCYGNQSPTRIEAMFDRLVRYCHPFWQYNRDSGIQGQEGKSIIGVEDEHSELIPARYRDNLQYEIKSTGFKHRIDVVRIQHGLPAFLLRGMDDYKAYYDAKRKGIDPLHILPEVALAEEIVPEVNQEARATFAEAGAFGYIVQIGSWYYFDPRREYAKSKIHPGRENRLEQGREKAEDAFVQRDDMVRLAEELIEHEIVGMGNRAAIELLDNRIAEHKETIAKMPMDADLRRQYEKEIQTLEAKQRQLGRIVPGLNRMAA